MGYGGKLLGLMVATGLWMPAAGLMVSERTYAQSEQSAITPQTFQGQLDQNSQIVSQDGSYYNAHTFEGRAGQVVQIDMESREFDTFLWLLTPDGSILERNDDFTETNSRIVITLPATGINTLWVNSYARDEIGRYALMLQVSDSQDAEPSRLYSEANRLYQQATQQYQVSQFREALQSWEQALEIYRNPEVQTAFPESRIGEGRALNNLGSVYADLGQYQQAADSYEQSLVVAREIDDQLLEGSILGNLGSVHIDLGQYEQAIDFYEQGLAIVQKSGDRAGENAILGNLGVAYASLAQYQQAIDFYEQSLSISREIGNRWGEGKILGNLGNVYENLGQYRQAINFHEQHLTIAREIGDRLGEGNALGNLGNAYMSLSQYQQAIDLFEQGFAVAREIGHRIGEGSALGSLGNAYFYLGQYQQAIDFHEQDLAIAREIGNREGEGQSLGNLGITYVGLGQDQQAIDFHEQYLAITRGTGDRRGEGLALNNLGATYYRLRQFSASTDAFLEAIAIFDTLRTADLPDAAKIAFFDTYLETYLRLQRSLIAQNEPEQALIYAERGRARAFVELLATRITTNGNPDAESLESISSPDLTEIQRIAREQNTTLVNYSIVFDESLLIWVVQPTGEIAFRSVELAGSSDGSPTINPIAAIDGPVYRSATSDSELTALVSESRSVVGERENPNTPQLQELHKLLIDPIADLLPSDPNAQVAFIPQRQLFLVPFAALQDEDGTYLIEKHTILTAPSIQVFGLANEAVGTRNVASLSTNNALVVGNPTMPTVWLPTEGGELAETQLSYLRGAKAEAEAIGNFFNIPVLTGEQATEARVKQLLPNASLIHLATHGLLEYGIPESSGVLDLPGAIALAPGNGEDGLLTSAEILEMDLQADLAILSACDTGRGRITGDGVVGLSRALITAGVPSVMVSLWAVNDDSTSLLMQRFYEFLATGEFTKAEALRQAQLSLLYDEDTETRLEAVRADISIETSGRRDVPTGSRHPYHWAPFILIGNGL